MLDTLLTAVLPVFALMAIGFGLGRAGVFDQAMAGAVNRFVFLISAPALIFGLLASSPFERFNWLALAAFAGIELVMYSAGFLIARYLFKREARESLLIGLATAFANHLLFVLPIAVALFGEGAVLPIVAIAAVDALFIYGGTLVLMDILSDTGASLPRVFRALSRNPQVLAAIGGLAVGVSGIGMAEGVHFFMKFAGSTAAPCALFALGVTLSLQQSEKAVLLPITICVLKLIVYPLLCLGLIVGVLGVELDWAKPMVMVAAAPGSAMAFVLALNYQVPPIAIARIVLLTMIGSLLTVTYASSL